MAVDRLSALDETFLRIESSRAHMHVGWTLLLDGPPPTIEELRRHVEARLVLLPRFRCCVVCSAFHDPLWADDPEFDIANHITAVQLPDPCDDDGLQQLAGQLLSIPLDRRRPLWRLHLIEALCEGQFALVGQAHHALVDGIAAVEMAQLLLDADPHGQPSIAARWRPQGETSVIERAYASVSERTRLLRAAGGVAMRALSRPTSLAEGISELRRVGGAISQVGLPSPRTSLNHPISGDRTVAFAGLSLPVAKELGKRADATVNDIVLSTTALALGRHLRRNGESHPWFRVMVPVNTRAAGDARGLGNQISVMFVELPTAESDPRAVLEEVCHQTRALKDGDHAQALDGVLRAARLAPAQLRDALSWLLTRAETFNAVVSNIPGPSQPLYLLGRRVDAVYPAVPLSREHGLSVGVLSYCGVLHVGLYADPCLVADLSDVARDFTTAFDALRFAFAPRGPAGGGRSVRSRTAPLGRVRRDHALV
jgi:WS/DGAT/MGAT family acyltransferase